MLLPKLGGFWLLPPRDFSHHLRVTLWITTAIHLDTPIGKPDPTLIAQIKKLPWSDPRAPIEVSCRKALT